MYRSFSWQSELHLKNIRNRNNQTFRQLKGGFWQAGYILNHQMRNEWPLLEVAFRYAIFSPEIPNFAKEEASLAINCFFNGHLNKLTTDVSFFEYEEEETNMEAQSWRFRIQYEVSF
jgi:phosphate-selective porin OprO and OprP